MDTKTCSKCKNPRFLSEFQKARDTADGLQGRCRLCRRGERANPLTKAKWRKKNREKINERAARWRRENPEEAHAKDARNYQRNRAANLARHKAYRQRYPDKRHACDLKFKYGITWAEYTDLLNSQSGGCAICGIKPDQSVKKKRLIVDHDHVTGKVRGLLCDKHNRAIGMFEDDPEMLIKAVLYLVENAAERIWLPLAA